MTSANQPVVGMCIKCGKPVRQGRRGFNRDEHGRVSHKFDCTHQDSAIQAHHWETGVDKYNSPALICKTCGYVWKASMPKPRTSCSRQN